jgi:hypothetical protein
MSIDRTDSRDARPGIADPAARLAGLLYIGTIAGGLYAELGVRARVRTDDAVATLHNIQQSPDFYRAGEMADLLMLGCYVVVTALLYRLFAPFARSLSLVAAGFSLVGIAVLAVAGVFHLAPLALIGDGAAADSARLAQLALRLHANLYGISLVFFGVYCVLIGWLCYASRWLPRTIGALMIVGGLAHLLSRSAWLLAPHAANLIPAPIAMLPLLGEAALAIWLVVFGMRTAEKSTAAP